MKTVMHLNKLTSNAATSAFDRQQVIKGDFKLRRDFAREQVEITNVERGYNVSSRRCLHQTRGPDVNKYGISVSHSIDCVFLFASDEL